MADNESPSSLRGQHESLAAWSLQATQQGKSIHEIVAAIYGVDLPLEAYSFYRFRPRDPELPIELLFFPWRLIDLVNPRHENDVASPWAMEQERNALEAAPDFLPLMKLEAYEARHDGWIIGYSLEELRRGRTTVIGHNEDIPAASTNFQRVGESLLSVLYEWAIDHQRMTKERFDSPDNRGAGSIEPEDVERAKDILKAIEKVQRKHSEHPPASP